MYDEDFAEGAQVVEEEEVKIKSEAIFDFLLV